MQTENSTPKHVAEEAPPLAEKQSGKKRKQAMDGESLRHAKAPRNDSTPMRGPSQAFAPSALTVEPPIEQQRLSALKEWLPQSCQQKSTPFKKFATV
jgi:hypothetical protein